METENKFKKKKKGKSFLQKAKKFGKQGQRGRGTEIDQDQYDYLVRVLERWREGFETDEEKKIFDMRPHKFRYFSNIHLFSGCVAFSINVRSYQN